MIYYIFYELIFGHFKDREWYLVKGLNVFQYVTFRTAWAAITALLMSLLFGRRVPGAQKLNSVTDFARKVAAHIAKRYRRRGRLLVMILW